MLRQITASLLTGLLVTAAATVCTAVAEQHVVRVAQP